LEAADGATGLEMARIKRPDLIIVDWEMPLIDGPQFVQMIRTPNKFPVPDIPIIILSAHSDHWRVVESARIGANEFVRKPVSIKTLGDRIVAILSRPRPTVKLEGYCGPAPRRVAPFDAFAP
jgi:DNA-binding response OmpR family regulator